MIINSINIDNVLNVISQFGFQNVSEDSEQFMFTIEDSNDRVFWINLNQLEQCVEALKLMIASLTEEERSQIENRNSQ